MDSNFKEWIWQIAVKKVVTRLVIVIVTYLSTVGLQKAGVNIDMAHFQEFLFTAIFGGLEMGRNWVKLKTGWKWL